MHFLVENPLLMLFVCIGLGCALGQVRFGPVQFGPAGVLFVALALSAINPEVKLPPILQALGLALLCYTIGLTSGPGFIAGLKRGWKQILVSLVAVTAMAGVALAAGKALGLGTPDIAGAFAGAATNTAALGAVQQQLAVNGQIPPEPAVGFAIGVPFAVLLTIVTAAVILSTGKRKPLPEDLEVNVPLVVKTVRVTQPTTKTLADLRTEHRAVVSRVTRDGHTYLAHGWDPIEQGDLLTVHAPEDRADAVVAELGEISDVEPWLDRTDLDFRRIALSNRKLVGKTLGELNLECSQGAIVSQVRRGDTDLIATQDLALELGDRLRVTAPRERLTEISKMFGDSERALTDINPIGLGLGLGLGILLGLVKIPLPGDGAIVLGNAVGPIIAGVILSILGRTGPITWTLPAPVSATLNQFGMVVFLACVGSAAGRDLVEALKTSLGIKLLILVLLLCLTHAILVALGSRQVLKYGSARSLGLLTGSQLNPAPFAYAMTRTGGDQRVAMGYALVFPISLIFKVIVAQLIVILGG